ncbi:hypothetical protein Tco_1331509 [Tanacetum coccineum]
MKVKMEYNGNNVVGALMNIPTFVGTFSILTDFTVLEVMDAYCDEGMADVIFGEPFLREVGINAKWFEGMITIHNGNEEVTYQMVRSHPRFKHRTNERCNKIPPLLKDLAAKKLAKLVKYQSSGFLCVIARILELKRRYFEDYCSEDQYAVSIKEDTAYLCLHSPKTTKETRSNTPYPGKAIRRIQAIWE